MLAVPGISAPPAYIRGINQYIFAMNENYNKALKIAAFIVAILLGVTLLVSLYIKDAIPLLFDYMMGFNDGWLALLYPFTIANIFLYVLYLAVRKIQEELDASSYALKTAKSCVVILFLGINLLVLTAFFSLTSSLYIECFVDIFSLILYIVSVLTLISDPVIRYISNNSEKPGETSNAANAGQAVTQSEPKATAAADGQKAAESKD